MVLAFCRFSGGTPSPSPISGASTSCHHHSTTTTVPITLSRLMVNGRRTGSRTLKSCDFAQSCSCHTRVGAVRVVCRPRTRPSACSLLPRSPVPSCRPCSRRPSRGAPRAIISCCTRFAAGGGPARVLHTARPGSSTQRGCRQLGGFAMPGGPPTRQWSEPVDCGESQHEREACTQEQQVSATFLPTHGPYHAFEAPNNGYARACAGPSACSLCWCYDAGRAHHQSSRQ